MDLPPEAVPSQGFWKGTHKRFDWGSLASRIHRRLCAAERSSAGSPLLHWWEEVETHDRRSSLVGGCDSHGPTDACLAIRFCVGCALIIPMIIQTILLYPSGAIWSDAEDPTRNRKVEGSNPSAGST